MLKKPSSAAALSLACPRAITQDIHDLDVYILSLAAEVDRFRCVTNYQGMEADASRNLWAIPNAIIHTSCVPLYRVRAFADLHLFQVHEGKPCDLLAVPRSSRTATELLRLSTTRLAEVNTILSLHGTGCRANLLAVGACRIPRLPTPPIPEPAVL